MSVLITGASGFVGQRLCQILEQQQTTYRAAVRHSASNPKQIPVGNITPNTEWRPALDQAQSVIHLAARVHIMNEQSSDPLSEFRHLNRDTTLHLARSAANQGVKRFVFISTIKVNGEHTPPEHPFTQCSSANPEDPYAISKWEAEQALIRLSKESDMEIVILRPPLIYGPRVKGNFIRLLSLVHKPLPLADVHNRRSLIYLDNFVDLIIQCLTQPSAANQTFLCQDCTLSTPELITALAHYLHRPNRLFTFPSGLLKALAKVTGKRQQFERLLSSLEIDDNHTRNTLQWQPPIDYQAGLKQTCDWFYNKPTNQI